MKHWRPVIVVVVAAVVVTLVFVLLGVLFAQNNRQRLSSCRATLIALESVAETAAAGIRDVPTERLDPGDKLSPLFQQQRAATIAENKRRRDVIARTTKAASDLANSDFCH